MTLPSTRKAADGQADHRAAAPLSKWGARARSVYTDAYAQRYRAADDQARASNARLGLSRWLRGVCGRFDGAIDVLDLGCGTGRYFDALANVKRLVGIDVSVPMLDRAGSPAGSVARPTLIAGDFLTHDFRPAEFDLVYSIGVLAEHAPFDEVITARVFRWLKSGGRFAFTTVHPRSSSVTRTLKRRLGEWLATTARGSLRGAVRARLMSEGIYADEERVRDVLAAAGFAVETVEPFVSDVHEHVLAVALKA